jgi:aminomethyltransferase
MVGWDKGDFTAALLRAQKERGADRKLIGFELLDAGIARSGHEVYVGDVKVGAVTSGTHTPFLKKAIGMVYVPIAHAGPADELEIDIRGRRTRAPRSMRS